MSEGPHKPNEQKPPMDDQLRRAYERHRQLKDGKLRTVPAYWMYIALVIAGLLLFYVDLFTSDSFGLLPGAFKNPR